jgi:hypothetical protein
MIIMAKMVLDLVGAVGTVERRERPHLNANHKKQITKREKNLEHCKEGILRLPF